MARQCVISMHKLDSIAVICDDCSTKKTLGWIHIESELYNDNPDDPDAEQRHHTYEASDECNCGYDVIVTATGIENPAGAKIKEWEFDFEGCKKSE